MRIAIWSIAFFLGVLFSIAVNADDRLHLTTNAFLDTSALPVLYTCDGQDYSPELSWSNAPTTTKSFALMVSDPSAPNGTFYHWVVYNIPASTKELIEAVKPLPAGTIVGENSFGKNQYNGPCPPKGSAHTYYFTLYALDTLIQLPATAMGATVLSAIQNHIIQQSQISTVYSRRLT